MKIAVASNDTHEVSAHLGHCATFLVYEIENDAVKGKETRRLEGGGQCQCHNGGLFSVIGDCSAVISGGMGQGLFQMLQEKGIKPIVTNESEADVAVEKYLKGTLTSSSAPSCNCSH